MKAKIILSIALLIGVAVSSATAQSYNKRANNNIVRVIQGKHSGELTRAEARHLSRHQQKIRQDYNRYKCNDGRLSRSERKKLEKAQRKASRQIYVYKHNRFDRY